MRTILKPFTLLFFLSLFSYRANAQWDPLIVIFSQMDPGTNGFFFNNLDSLNENWNPDLGTNGGLFDQLYDNLLDSVPPGSLDSSYLNGLDAGLDSLFDHLPGYGLNGTDTDTLLGEIDWINNIFQNNFDSLGGLFGQYHDSLATVPNYWNITIIGFDSHVNEQYNYLLDSFNIAGGLSNPSGLGDLPPLFGNLFDANIFPDIEIAFGTQNADLKYYEDRYSVNAKVVRIGSVPRFDKDVSNFAGTPVRFPLEARWHAEASWTDKPRYSLNNTEDPDDKDKIGFNPLLLSGDFAIMTTPRIGKLGNTTFRLLTSLGTELGTYAPAHRDYNPIVTSINKGFMTGLGAQVGVGFSFSTGAITAYSMGTFAQGQALRCPKPYHYNSRRYEVGIRYGNIINVRYSTGFISWQSRENRQADVKNQFTVGIILAELHH